MRRCGQKVEGKSHRGASVGIPGEKEHHRLCHHLVFVQLWKVMSKSYERPSCIIILKYHNFYSKLQTWIPNIQTAPNNINRWNITKPWYNPRPLSFESHKIESNDAVYNVYACLAGVNERGDSGVLVVMGFMKYLIVHWLTKILRLFQ